MGKDFREDGHPEAGRPCGTSIAFLYERKKGLTFHRAPFSARSRLSYATWKQVTTKHEPPASWASASFLLAEAAPIRRAHPTGKERASRIIPHGPRNLRHLSGSHNETLNIQLHLGVRGPVGVTKMSHGTGTYFAQFSEQQQQDPLQLRHQSFGLNSVPCPIREWSIGSNDVPFSSFTSNLGPLQDLTWSEGSSMIRSF